MDDNRVFSIYMFTNTLNGKRYIGQTCQDIDKRFSQHKNLANASLDSRRSYLHNAISKYGLEAFTFEIIDSCCGSEAADTMEINYIQLFETTVPKGYNVRVGGQNNHQGHRNKVSIQISFDGKSYPSISAAAKDNKMSFAKFENFLQGKNREQVFEVSIGGVKYTSMSDAARSLGTTRSKVKSLLEGKKPQSKECTIDGVVYHSIKSASEALGVCRETAKKMASGGTKWVPSKVTYNGITYSSMAEASRELGVHQTTLKAMILNNRDKHPSKTEVIVLGTTYRSVADAKRSTGFSYEKIQRLNAGGDLVDTSCTIHDVTYESKTAAAMSLGITLRGINRYLATGSTESTPNIKRSVSYNGEVFSSMSQLAKKYGFSKDTIYRMAADKCGVEFIVR